MTNNIKMITVSVERKPDNVPGTDTFIAYAYTARKADKILRGAATAKEAADKVIAALGPAFGLSEDQYTIRYKFDTMAFLDYYTTELPLVGLEKICGINQRQLSHYATGHRVPSKATVQKIDRSVKAFAKALAKVSIR